MARNRETEARKLLEGVAAAGDGALRGADLHSLRLAIRLAAECGLGDLARRSFEALPAHGAPARLLAAEHWMLAGELERAREQLQAMGSENLIGPALLAVLDRHAIRPGAGAAPNGRGLEPPEFWFEPVLTHLVFFLERRLEQRLEEAPAAPAVHQARTALFRGEFLPEYLLDPRPGPIRRLFEFLKSRSRRERERREGEVYDRLLASDLDAAAAALERWMADDPEAFVGPLKPAAALDDPRAANHLELLFARHRFSEVLERYAGAEARGEAKLLLALQLAYAELACGRAAAAEKRAGDAFAAQRTRPEAAHLLGLAHLRAGAPARAIAWFRRAVERGDVAMVELAQKEIECIEDGAAPSNGAERSQAEAAHATGR